MLYGLQYFFLSNLSSPSHNTVLLHVWYKYTQNTDYFQFLSLIPYDITVITFSCPYAAVTEYIVTIIALKGYILDKLK